MPVFGVGESDGVHFYAMQFIRGEGLDQVLRRPAPAARGSAAGGRRAGRGRSVAHSLLTGRFAAATTAAARRAEPDAPADRPPAPPGRTVVGAVGAAARRRSTTAAWPGIGVQVAEALAYAHRQGVLHRDIKPSNLLLDPQGTVWVTDFGLAKAEGTDDLTQTGDIVGTLRYMAPERFEGQLAAAERRLRAGADAVRAADAAAGVRRHQQGAADRAGAARPAAAAAQARPAGPARPGDGRAEGAGQGPGAALPDRRRPGGGPAPLPGRPADPAPAQLRGRADLALVPAQPGGGGPPGGRGRVAGGHRHRLLGDALAGERGAPGCRDELAARPGGTRAGPLAQARAGRFSRQAGRRFKGLAALDEAARLARELNAPEERFLELRNEAIACMALTDVRPSWRLEDLARGDVTTGFNPQLAFDSRWETYARGAAEGNVSVRRLADDQEIAHFSKPGHVASILLFSPDGRYLAAKYYRNHSEQPVEYVAWDWRQGKAVVRQDCAVPGRPTTDFAFTADSRQADPGWPP